METRFRLKRGDFEVELAGDQAWVEAQLAAHLDRWEGREPRVEAKAAPDIPRVPADFRPKVNVTPAAFVAQKGAAGAADLFVVGVYYMEKYLQKETFDLDALQAVLAEVPAWECHQAADVVEEALVRGHVERLRDGRFSITYKGQNYVRDGLT